MNVKKLKSFHQRNRKKQIGLPIVSKNHFGITEIEAVGDDNNE